MNTVARITSLACAICIPFIASGSPVIVSDSPAHALISSEDHSILAPGSADNFRWPRNTMRPLHAHRVQVTRGLPWRDRTPGWQQTAASIPVLESELPGVLYRLEKKADGWRLWLRQEPQLACAVILGPTVFTSSGRVSYALRSAGPIGNTNAAGILWRGTLLGADDGLHFLSTSTPLKDKAFGSALMINLPERAIYGYWENGISELVLAKGSFIRVRLYAMAYAWAGARAQTYRIPLR